MACHGNYWPLYEQPVGFEQMSRIPRRVIRLIYNHRHFQCSSPAWPPPLQAPGCDLILAQRRRKSIRSCLCRRCAPLIFMSCEGTEGLRAVGEHDLGGVCDSMNMISGGRHMRRDARTKRSQIKYSGEFESRGASSDSQWNLSSQSCVSNPSAWCSSFTGPLPVMLSSMQGPSVENTNGSGSNDCISMDLGIPVMISIPFLFAQVHCIFRFWVFVKPNFSAWSTQKESRIL